MGTSTDSRPGSRSARVMIVLACQDWPVPRDLGITRRDAHVIAGAQRTDREAERTGAQAHHFIHTRRRARDLALELRGRRRIDARCTRDDGGPLATADDQQDGGGRGERTDGERTTDHVPARGRPCIALGCSDEQRRAHGIASRGVGPIERQLGAELAQTIVVLAHGCPPFSIASRSARRASCNRRHKVPALTPSTRATSTPGTSSRSHST